MTTPIRWAGWSASGTSRRSALCRSRSAWRRPSASRASPTARRRTAPSRRPKRPAPPPGGPAGRGRRIRDARLCDGSAAGPDRRRRAAPGRPPLSRTLLGRAVRHVEAADAQAVAVRDGARHRLIARCARNRPLPAAVAPLDRIRPDPDRVAQRAGARSRASIPVALRGQDVVIGAALGPRAEGSPRRDASPPAGARRAAAPGATGRDARDRRRRPVRTACGPGGRCRRAV